MESKSTKGTNDQIMSREGPFLFVNFYISRIFSRKIITQDCGVLFSLILIVLLSLHQFPIQY